MKILVTGAKGFVGRNLVSTLQSQYEVMTYDQENTWEDLERFTQDCDFVIHLAGVNRPTRSEEFYEGNASLTEKLCQLLQQHNNKAPIMISSSVQAEKDNDYGKSKKLGEEVLFAHSKLNHSPVYVYRFANLFGKWSRPNYNTVIATWCYNIARDLPITVNDPSVALDFCYIDDVVEELVRCIEGRPTLKEGYGVVPTLYRVSLGEVLALLQSFKAMPDTLLLPNTADEFTNKLYATYLSFLPTDKLSYAPKTNVDQRGSFTELFKTLDHGQVSVNISKPGITKGNHWHHTKNEKFVVVSGKGVIRFRHLHSEEVIEYFVSGDRIEIVDIPTGYTHNIENIGDTDLITIMWANEAFDPNRADTHMLEV
ncbi:MAG: NAD-dependent epimerase/dehydratase family protein [Erysipelotrichaceae bacterium]